MPASVPDSSSWMFSSCDLPTAPITVSPTTVKIQLMEVKMLKPKSPNCPQLLMSQKTTLFQFQNQQQSYSADPKSHCNWVKIPETLVVHWKGKSKGHSCFLLNFIDFIWPWLRKMIYYCLPGACVKSGVEIAMETGSVLPPTVSELGMGPWNLTLYSSPQPSL